MHYNNYIYVSFKNCFLIGLLQAHRSGAILLPTPIYDLIHNNLLIQNNTPPSPPVDLDYLLTIYNQYMANT